MCREVMRVVLKPGTGRWTCLHGGQKDGDSRRWEAPVLEAARHMASLDGMALHVTDLVLLTWRLETPAGGARCRSAQPSSSGTSARPV